MCEVGSVKWEGGRDGRRGSSGSNFRVHTSSFKPFPSPLMLLAQGDKCRGFAGQSPQQAPKYAKPGGAAKCQGSRQHPRSLATVPSQSTPKPHEPFFWFQ